MSRSGAFQIALSTIAALASAGAIYGLYSLYNKKRYAGMLPALNEEITLDILESILKKTQLDSQRFLQGFMSIKQQINAQGQDMPDKEIMKAFIFPAFLASFEEIQSAVYEEFDVDEDEVEDATSTYSSDGSNEVGKKIAMVSSKIREIYSKFGGDLEFQEDDDEGDDEPHDQYHHHHHQMKLPELLNIVDAISDKMRVGMKHFIDKFIAEHGTPQSDAELMRFNEGMMAFSRTAESSILDQYGMTSMQLEQVMRKHQDSEVLNMKFFQMNQEAAMMLQEAGINRASG